MNPCESTCSSFLNSPAPDSPAPRFPDPQTTKRLGDLGIWGIRGFVVVLVGRGKGRGVMEWGWGGGGGKRERGDGILYHEMR